MDGILIDTEPIWRQVEIEVFGSIGIHRTEEECLESMGVRIEEIVESCYRTHPWSGPSTAEITRRMIQGVIDEVTRAGEPLPGVRHALETVRAAGMPVGIASSSSEDLIEAVLTRLGIESYIQAICSGDREPAGKPHPAVYRKAAKSLGVPAGHCLAIEDSPNGVLAAKSAGMICIAIPDRHFAADPRMKRADLRLESLEQISASLLADLGRRVAASA